MKNGSILSSRASLHALLGLLAFLCITAPAWADFGVDSPVTSGPYSRFLGRNSAHAVAADGRGNVHVIYGAFEMNNGYDQEVVPTYRMYDRESGAWSPQSRVADPADRVVCWWNVAIATDCDDDAHMVWVQMGVGPGAGLLYRVRHADGSFGPIEVVPGAEGNVDSPSLAIDRHGDVFVCWAEGYYNTDSGFLFNVRCAVRDAQAGVWDAPFSLTSYVVGVDPSPGAINPSVATQGFKGTRDTVAHFAWDDVDQGHVAYRWLKRNYDGGTYDPLPATTYLSGTFEIPSIAVSCRTVHVVWGAGGVIEHRIATTGYGPGSVTFLPAVPTGLSGGAPNIAVDGLGNVQLVTPEVLHATWSPVTQAWTATAGDVDDGLGATEWASIATDPRGDLHVVWMDGRDPSAEHIYYDRGSCMVHPAPPAGAPLPLSVFLPLDLKAAAAAAGPQDRLPVILQMREQPDLGALERIAAGLGGYERRRMVVAALRDFSDRSQAGLRGALAIAEGSDDAEALRPLWIVNAIAARVSPALLEHLASRDDVGAIYYDPKQRILDASSSPDGGMGDRSTFDALRRTAAGASRVEGAGGALPPAAPPPPDVAWGVSWIGAPAVWDMGYKGQCILVAVLDTGIDATHPDLANRVWVNADETPGNNIDDDGNGYVDDVHGYDIANGDPNPVDALGHGTHVAGTIAGDGSGGTITGVAPEARLMAVQVIEADGSGTEAGVVEGVQYAIANGAQVLNLSLGFPCPSVGMRRFLRLEGDVVKTTGVTMCVAAGNEHCSGRPPNEVETPGDIPPPWLSPDQPVLGATSGVTTIGATDYQVEDIAPFSAHGPVDWSQTDFPFGDWGLCDPVTPNVGLMKPDLCAPGMRIKSTQMGGGYVGEAGPEAAYWWGTSMATPHVTGLVALLLSKNHELLSPDIEEILETSSIDLGPLGKDNVYGAGRVSAPNAIAAVAAQVDPTIDLVSHAVHDTVGTADGDGALDAGEIADLTVTLHNNGPYMLGDVTARLDANANVTVLKNNSYFGDFIVNETRANDDDPFRVQVAEDAPDGAVVTFTLTMTAYGDCRTVMFTDTLHTGTGPCAHIADHDAGGVRFSVTDQGIAGFLAGDQAQGAGFVFPKSGGVNRLYIGSLWAGSDTTYVLNRDYDADPVKDWESLGCLMMEAGGGGDPVPADQVGVGSYDDSGNPAPRGLRIVQRSYAWAAPPDDDSVILAYTAINGGAGTLRNLWLGLFMDWDLDAAGGYDANMGSTDASRDLVYMWRSGGGDGAYVGLRSLSHTHPLQLGLVRNSTFVWPLSYITDSDRYHLLTGDAPEYRVSETPAPDDWGAVIGIAPFNLAPGESVRVAFAVLAGTSLADLQANADAAATRWTGYWGAATDIILPLDGPRSSRLELAPPAPNPFSATTSLDWGVSRPGGVRLEVFDVAGRRVAELVKAAVPAGMHHFTWDGRTAGGRPLAAGTYYIRLTSAAGEQASSRVVIAR